MTQDPAKDGDNWYVYCGNNPINRVDPDGRAYEASKAWAATAWGLCLADGPAPVGEAIYVGVEVTLVVGETLYLFGDKIVSLFQDAPKNGETVEKGAETG